jgi:formylglycine-generating enzyme required for sulfatase activity
MPDAPGAALPPLDNAPVTEGARRQRLILMFCGAAVTIGVGVAIALLMDEASAPLRLGTGTPAAGDTSGASGAAPGLSGGGLAAEATADAACPLAGGPAACPAMVAVPAGRYRIGSQRNDPDALPEEFGGAERPIAAFELSSHEITAGQWQQCVNDQACPLPAQPAESAAMPVTGISWDAAAGYAAWLSRQTGRQYRLPTEAEWEYAARAGAATTFPWGDRLGQRNAQCGQCGALADFPRFAPVGTYPARRGLYDMVGNAYEWVADCWTSNHAQPLPPATAACRDKVQKGGAYDTLEADVRPVARTYGDRTVPDLRVGFRVARELQPAPPPMSMQTTDRTPR